MNKAHLTAIARTKLSAPCRYLKEKGLLIGSLLDYGCGRGVCADILGATKYDMFYFPDITFMAKQYDTIYCNFVLNVVNDPIDREHILEYIRTVLKEGGKAYITVRRDMKRLKGWTSKGTWQGFIELDLPVVYEKKGKFIIYELTK